MADADRLTLADLPNEDDEVAVFEFAMLFDGYERCGSFEACAKRAKLRDRRTLEDLQNEMFFAARASRHRMDDAYLVTYRELRPLFVAKIAAD